MIRSQSRAISLIVAFNDDGFQVVVVVTPDDKQIAQIDKGD
jgi:hypothetical protein